MSEKKDLGAWWERCFLDQVCEDRQRVARLRAGQAAAFDEVYQAYRPRLFSFLARLTGQPALAEDLLQETFLRLARSAPSLAADTRLGAWLFTVARNLFISHQRWALLDVARLAEHRLFAMLRGAEPTPFALAAANQTQQRLELAVAALPMAHREVLLLVAVERLTPTEAAGVLGLEPATVRKRLSRARAMIAPQLRLHEGEGDGSS